MKEIKYICDNCKEPIKNGGMINGYINFNDAGFNHPPKLIYVSPDNMSKDLCEKCMLTEIERYVKIKMERL